MKKNNKKGFTLVELLAVVVILIIIIVIAVTIVKNHTLEAKKKSVLANSITYVRAVNTLVVDLKLSNNPITNGSFNVSDIDNRGIAISGAKPDAGFVVIQNSSVVYACLLFDEYRTIFQNGSYQDVDEGKCIDVNQRFDYTGSEQRFVAQLSGVYRLEVWGAQGGGTYGGKGGYATGEINLTSGDILYINVGGTTSSGNGGYNGGGTNAQRPYGGGGATHIATRTGTLSSLETYGNNILIVAGGGGGEGQSSQVGGSGGGFIGGNGVGDAPGRGASQTAGGAVPDTTCNSYTNGSFGTGGQCYWSNEYIGAGGGGYYGGGSGTGAGNNGSGGGGSGFINTTLLENSEMYCYNCSESEQDETKTISVQCQEQTATEYCAKLGNGYAKVSFVSMN